MTFNDRTPMSRAQRAWWLTAVALAGVVVATIWPESTVGMVVYAGLGVFAAGSIFWSIVVWRRRPTGAWVAVGTSLLLFMVASWFRTTYATLGDVSDTRSLLPDLFAIPGYVLLGLGLALLVRSRRRLLPGAMDSLLDAAVAGLAALSLAWVFMISPALTELKASTAVKVSLAVYPPMSVVLVVFAAQLAFVGRSGRLRASSLAAMTAMGWLFVGDVIYTLADAQLLESPKWLINLPYGVAFAAIVPLVWHPTAADFSDPIPLREATPAKLRLPVIGVALALPAFIASLRGGAPMGDRVVFAVISISLSSIGIVRLVRSIAAQARTEEVLRYQATHDPLTRLPNRSSAIAHLDAQILNVESTNVPLAVLFLDLDRFKLVNDTYGHGMGDALLVSVADRIRDLSVRTSLAARIGGDEFVIVLDGVRSLEDAVIQADDVRAALSRPIKIRDIELPASASIGVAFADGTDEGLTGEEMLRDADTAMYQAKAAGRDAVVVFDAAMRDVVSRRLELETDLHHAADRGELEVVYQPIVSLPSERISGFEALVRWHHPVLGTVSPGEFIPIAEETGMIVKLGDWVLERALAQLSELRREVRWGESFTMAVNVSTRQLLDDRLVGRVATLLEKYEIPDGRLYLEVTESVLMDDPETLELVLRRLRDTGVRLSIDDFGTGYSSLAYLRRFPFDRVKIDRAFVDGLDRAPTSERSLITAIVAMAEALQLDTVAEGVEQPGEADALATIGCTAAQGFYFWRPVSADQLASAIVRLGVVETASVRVSNSK